jgi:hypothetical protein
MMFFGPKAASPPKKTCGRVDCSVNSSSTGSPQRSNSMPHVALDPREGVLLPDRDQHLVAGHHSSGSPVGTSCAGPARRTRRAPSRNACR